MRLTFVQKVVYEHLNDWLDRNPNEAADIIRKGIAAATARVAARKARDLTRRKGLLESASLPGKLFDCWSDDPTKCEIFISRATPPAARPSPAATRSTRRSSRSAARSSTSRRRASTASCRTRRSRR
ncbi:DNA gyrase subunit B [Streptomyces fumanus]